MDETEFELLGEIRGLAQQMLRMDLWIREAYIRRKFVRVGELVTQREGVRQRRSDLMRDLFVLRYRRRVQV